MSPEKNSRTGRKTDNIMAAEKGNTYAVGNEGGRPPIYDSNKPEDVKKISDLCDEYFTYIQGEYDGDEKEIGPDQYVTEKKWIRAPEPPTVTGLTLHVGFESKSTLYEYAKKDEFSYPIKRALTKIEQYHEMATAMGDKCTGNIFILKNFNWVDSQKYDHTTNGKDMPASGPPTIVFKKIENTDEQ